MNRREFIKLLATSGVAAGTLPLLSRKSYAAATNSRFLVEIEAGGGWDTTCLFDPKGTAHNVNRIDIDDSLITADGIRWSAVPDTVANSDRIRDQYRRFFTTYSSRLSVVRGMNCLTTSHQLGGRLQLTGAFGTHPALGALFGAVHGSELPLSYLTFGSTYGKSDYTAGLSVTKALLGHGDLITDIADPAIGQTENVYDKITAAHIARLHRQIEKETGTGGLPLKAQRLQELLEQRLQPSVFAELAQNLSQLQDESRFQPDWFPQTSAVLKQQARITAASFATGSSCSAHMKITGFDSHVNNDGRQFEVMSQLLEGIHYLNESLAYFGLADKTTIVVVSDIGRSRVYNNDSGKDHGRITGQMILHPQNSGHRGNTFGATTADFREQRINLQTGTPDDSGAVLNTRHMLLALREYLGLAGTPEADEFPLSESIVPGVFS